MRTVYWLCWNNIIVKCHNWYVKVTSSYHVASQHIQQLFWSVFKLKNVVFNGEQEKESIIRERVR